MFYIYTASSIIASECTVSSTGINGGTVRFLVEIQNWSKKRFQGILKSSENASRDQSLPKIGLNSH